MKSDHEIFIDKLKNSYDSVWHVARLFSEGGNQVTLPPATLPKNQHQARNNPDECDFEITYRVDVKHRTIDFTRAADFPFKDFFVCQKRAYDNLAIKPRLIIILSRNKKYIAIANTRFETMWHTVKKKNGDYNNYTQEYYVSPLEYILFKPVEYLKCL